jgi:glyoxylase-like metal-dependent hydrolase (beta-lactamase superfamily II)
MNIRKIVVGQLDVNCYIVSDDLNPDALIIDPGDESDKIIEAIDLAGLKPKYILFTHAHYDHVCAVKELRDRYRAIIVMHEMEKQTYLMTARRCMSWGYDAEDFPEADLTVRDGDIISIGSVPLKVIHTPGHSGQYLHLWREHALHRRYPV